MILSTGLIYFVSMRAFVEEKARGNALGSKLLEHARIEGGKLGFDKLYLCTDHTSYYEKYEWKYMELGVMTGRHIEDIRSSNY